MHAEHAACDAAALAGLQALAHAAREDYPAAASAQTEQAAHTAQARTCMQMRCADLLLAALLPLARLTPRAGSQAAQCARLRSLVCALAARAAGSRAQLAATAAAWRETHCGGSAALAALLDSLEL